MKKPALCSCVWEELVHVNRVGRAEWLYEIGHYDSMGNVESAFSCPICIVCLDEVCA
jgi:hypothetical protein